MGSVSAAKPQSKPNPAQREDCDESSRCKAARKTRLSISVVRVVAQMKSAEKKIA